MYARDLGNLTDCELGESDSSLAFLSRFCFAARGRFSGSGPFGFSCTRPDGPACIAREPVLGHYFKGPSSAIWNWQHRSMFSVRGRADRLVKRVARTLRRGAFNHPSDLQLIHLCTEHTILTCNMILLVSRCLY